MKLLRFKMAPTLPQKNQTNSVFTNGVLGRQGGLGYPAREAAPQNLKCFNIAQFGASLLFAARHPLGMPVRGVVVSSRHSAFSNRIASIPFGIRNEQMAGIHTGRVIAVVTDILPAAEQAAEAQLERDAVSPSLRHTGNAEGAVAVRDMGTCPRPAPIGVGTVYFGPETNAQSRAIIEEHRVPPVRGVAGRACTTRRRPICVPSFYHLENTQAHSTSRRHRLSRSNLVPSRGRTYDDPRRLDA